MGASTGRGVTVVLLAMFFPPNPSGGSARAFKSALAFARSPEVERVYVLASRRPLREDRWGGRSPGVEGALEGLGVRVIRLPLPPVRHGGAAARAVLYLLYSAMALPPLLWILLRARGDRLVVAHTPHVLAAIVGRAASALTGARLVHVVHDVWPDEFAEFEGGGMVLRIVDWLARISYSSPDALIVASEEMREYLSRKLGGRHPPAIVGYTGSVLAEVSAPVGEGAAAPGGPAGRGAGRRIVLGYLGNVGHSSGLAEVVRMLRECCAAAGCEVDVLVVGVGRFVESLGREGRGAAGLRVRVLGPLPPEGVATVLGGVDALLLPIRGRVIGSIGTTTKIFDYLYLCRPIVLIAEAEGGPASRIVGRLFPELVVGWSLEGVCAALREVCLGGVRVERGDCLSILEEIDRDRSMDRAAREVLGILFRGGEG